METRPRYVIHVMGMDSSKYGGIERFNVAISKALLEKGYPSIFVYESQPVNTEFMDDLDNNNAKVFVSKSRKHSLGFCVDFIRLIKRYRPVLVHAHFTKARFYAIPIARIMGVKRLFFTIHSQVDSIEEIKYLTRLWYAIANRIAKVIAVSQDIATAYLQNWPEARVQKIYLGVNKVIGNKFDNRRRLGISQEQLVLLSVANFNYIKGLDVLCRAVSFLKQERRWKENAHLYIVGQPDHDRLELQDLINDLEIQDCIDLVGISDDVPVYMTSADIYIQPSRSEGIGLALMEAASASLPLVGTKVGGIPEVVNDGKSGILVDSEDSEMLACAIERLMCSPDLRKEMGAYARIMYQNEFVVDQGVKQTILYYGI